MNKMDEFIICNQIVGYNYFVDNLDIGGKLFVMWKSNSSYETVIFPLSLEIIEASYYGFVDFIQVSEKELVLIYHYEENMIFYTNIDFKIINFEITNKKNIEINEYKKNKLFKLIDKSFGVLCSKDKLLKDVVLVDDKAKISCIIDNICVFRNVISQPFFNKVSRFSFNLDIHDTIYFMCNSKEYKIKIYEYDSSVLVLISYDFPYEMQYELLKTINEGKIFSDTVIEKLGYFGEFAFFLFHENYIFFVSIANILINLIYKNNIIQSNKIVHKIKNKFKINLNQNGNLIFSSVIKKKDNKFYDLVIGDTCLHVKDIIRNPVITSVFSDGDENDRNKTFLGSIKESIKNFFTTNFIIKSEIPENIDLETKETIGRFLYENYENMQEKAMLEKNIGEDLHTETVIGNYDIFLVIDKYGKLILEKNEQ